MKDCTRKKVYYLQMFNIKIQEHETSEAGKDWNMFKTSLGIKTYVTF